MPPRRVHIGGDGPRPVCQEGRDYPRLAKPARIEGLVRLQIVIGGDGNVQDVKVLSGHPLLVESAILAVSMCRYPPTLLNGKPIEVETEFDLNYQLSK